MCACKCVCKYACMHIHACMGDEHTYINIYTCILISHFRLQSNYRKEHSKESIILDSCYYEYYSVFIVYVIWIHLIFF